MRTSSPDRRTRAYSSNFITGEGRPVSILGHGEVFFNSLIIMISYYFSKRQLRNQEKALLTHLNHSCFKAIIIILKEDKRVRNIIYMPPYYF
jgi:hypothetical protein